MRTFKQLMEYVLTVTERKRLLMPLPFALAKFQAQFLQYLPKPPLTPDQVELLKTDNVVSDAAAREGRTLKGLGIDATAMEDGRADLSLALPQGRPIQGARRVTDEVQLFVVVMAGHSRPKDGVASLRLCPGHLA